MKILIAGGTGFIGRELSIALTKENQAITLLTRNPDKHKNKFPAPCKWLSWQDSLEGFDAIINLAGNSLVKTRWHKKGKEEIRSSRIQTTRSLVETIKKLKHKPKVFIQASAVGFYGDRGDEILTESSSPGAGFLSDVCQEWEAPLKGKDFPQEVRWCIVRLAPVLGRSGGVLATLDFLYQWCLASQLGNGENYFPWIHIQDLLHLIQEMLRNESYSGIFNATAPHPVPYREFHQAMKRAKHRPLSPPSVPAALIKLMFGPKQEFFLSSTRAVPQRLTQQEFKFQFADLPSALANIYAG